MKITFFLFFLLSLVYANPLQDAINNAPPYSTLKLSSGIYKGSIVINKPITLEGKDEGVIIDADNTGSVITILSSDVHLKKLTIKNSGSQMHTIDAAISMQNVQHCSIEKCTLLNSLYGIDMAMVKDSNISDNYITSKKLDLPMRGDALKMYYAHNNIIANNTIENSRDVTLNYSHHNLFKNNRFVHNRFATHLSLSNNNKFHNNLYKYNSVSIMVMGAKETLISHNRLLSANGAAGIALMVKGVKNFVCEHNKISFNAKAIYIDGQEKAKGMKRYINYNDISYNKEALHFHASIKDNTITHNRFFANIDDIVKDIGGNFSSSNKVEYNYWDRYTGFDRNNDNIGDTPHKVYQYADQLWHYNNKIKFFYASPTMTLLNFLSNLAPFIEPNLIMQDSKPVFTYSGE